MYFRDVILAYDDEANGTIGSRDVTIAHDDDTRGLWVQRYSVSSMGIRF